MRLYAIDELAADGYPLAWHEVVKHAVRDEAGHRCVRCGHPYLVGQTAPEWSLCDERCTHGGPLRVAAETAYGATGSYGLFDELEPARALAASMQPDGGGVYGARVEAKWRVLTVHHLDGDKANCRWWNLVALCQRCHLQIQNRVQMARVWPWEHSVWFRPYVAGYYAFAYLGEDLDREAVEARQDELLALERAA
jgi:hypothetical protein